jgi:hypothetical protein
MPGRPKAATQLQPIEARQPKVEHNDIDLVAHGCGKTPFAVWRVVHAVAAAFKKIPDVGGDVVLIFDDQHMQA